MRIVLIILLFTPFFASCQSEKQITSIYPKSVGDIEFDSNLDKKDFTLCDEDTIAQYFNFPHELLYKGGKIAIEKEFKQKYQLEKSSQENGLIRIRFVVNCKGETDRFRVIGMDENYKEKEFDGSIIRQLVQITKELKGWKAINFENYKSDYYQYLIFKIENGSITEILP